MSDTSDTPSGGVEYDETEDNSEDSVLLDDPTYVGVDPIYKNSAYEINKPMLSEPDSDEEGTRPGSLLNAEETLSAEENAQKVEADHAVEVESTNPRQTWKTDTVHPSEKKKTRGVVASSVNQPEEEPVQAEDQSEQEEEEQTESGGQQTNEPRSPFAT